MRKLKGLILIGTLVTVFSMASAQMEIRIDGQPIPTDAISDIVIMPNENLLEITTTSNYDVDVQVIGDGVAITSFTASSYTVVEGQDVTFTWTTSNANDCDATGGVDGWAESAIGANGSKVISTSTVDNNQYTLECSDANDTVTDSVIVATKSEFAVAITSFTATPNAITAGETTTLNWSTLNADSCTPTGGTDDWQSTVINPDMGDVDITIPLAGNYVFGLDCTGTEGDTDSANSSVVVSAIQTECTEPSLDGLIIPWVDVFDYEFPLPVGGMREINLSRNGYRAIEFTTTSEDDRGSITSIGNVNTTGLRLGAISECPGNFDVADNCRRIFGYGGIVWNTADETSDCPLKKDTTYYMNFTFTDGESPESSSCEDTFCMTNLRVYNPQ